MDFARKQMEKFGWKEGSGLGKNNQGMLEAIKPNLKVGKEGMGYDFSKELVDTWWTRAYDDSLNRINVQRSGDEEASETVGVTLQEDDDDRQKGNEGEGLVSSNIERPFEKMRKRMMKATFTTFSKGATLSNGEMIVEPTKMEPDSDGSTADDDAKKKPKVVKTLTDEELFQACGGRTAHKAARFGLKLNGKLARIAAQEAAAKALLSSFKKAKSETSTIPTRAAEKTDQQCPLSSSPSLDPCDITNKSSKNKKKKSKCEYKEISSEYPPKEEEAETTNNSALSSFTKLICSESQQMDLDKSPESEKAVKSKKKKKKHQKRKYAELEEVQEAISSAPLVNENLETEIELEEIYSKDRKAHKKSKKSKKRKNFEIDEEAHVLCSE